MNSVTRVCVRKDHASSMSRNSSRIQVFVQHNVHKSLHQSLTLAGALVSCGEFVGGSHSVDPSELYELLVEKLGLPINNVSCRSPPGLVLWNEATVRASADLRRTSAWTGEKETK